MENRHLSEEHGNVSEEGSHLSEEHRNVSEEGRHLSEEHGNLSEEHRHLTVEQKRIIEAAVRNILLALGDDPDREGLIETPSRVARMYDEVFEGMRYTNQEIADRFGRCFDEPASGGMVLVKNIDAFSYCEHHMALMYRMKISVAYLPRSKVIGLSKVARIADMVCKRLQLQERITSDIAEIMQMILDTEDVLVHIEGEHSCMTARGIKKPGTVTATTIAKGRFEKDAALRAEVFSQL